MRQAGTTGPICLSISGSVLYLPTVQYMLVGSSTHLSGYPITRVPEELAVIRIGDEIIWPLYSQLRLTFTLLSYSSLSLRRQFFYCITHLPTLPVAQAAVCCFSAILPAISAGTRQLIGWVPSWASVSASALHSQQPLQTPPDGILQAKSKTVHDSWPLSN